MTEQQKTMVLKSLLHGSLNDGITKAECTDLLQQILKSQDATKPPLTDAYNRRCGVCNVSPIHKNNSSGICTDCAVFARAQGTYSELVIKMRRHNQWAGDIKPTCSRCDDRCIVNNGHGMEPCPVCVGNGRKA